MNVEAYNLDSLRALIRSLQDENLRLKALLDQANVAYETADIFDKKLDCIEVYDPDQGGRILDTFITKELANQFFSMFWGRTDVYARRGAKGGYFPQCNNRWDASICPKQRGEKIYCEDCGHTEWTNLTPKKIISHLVGYREDGTDVLGVYPLFPDGTCRFIVFDFDYHEKGAEITDFANVTEEWHDEVDALRLICESNGIAPLVERSRSGRGAHVWILFKKPVSAALARSFGFLLLDKGSASINLKSFHYYDRMYPSQDTASSIGNLIALPLQGSALKNGNSAFVDKNWNAYPDQWDFLMNHAEKLSTEKIAQLMAFLMTYCPGTGRNRGRKSCSFLKRMLLEKCTLFWEMVFILTRLILFPAYKIKSEVWQPLIILYFIKTAGWGIPIIITSAQFIWGGIVMDTFVFQGGFKTT